VSRRAFALLVLFVAVLAGILLMNSGPGDRVAQSDELFLPELAGALNDVRRIRVERAGGTTVATLVRGEDRWTVPEAGGYPADIGRIRSTLLTLADARIVELKTAKPELHDRLGVEDIQANDATGTRLSFSLGDRSLAVIIGDTSLAGGTMAYARRGGENQAVMIAAGLDLGRDAAAWLDTRIADIESARVHAVAVTEPDGQSFRIEKESPAQTDFTLRDVPDGREAVSAGTINALGAALASLDFDRVAPAADDEFGGTAPTVTRFELFDGLVIEARAWQTADGIRLRFAAHSDEKLAGQSGDRPAEAAPGQAAALNERLSGWTYTLPSYKAGLFAKTLEDLLKPTD